MYLLVHRNMNDEESGQTVPLELLVQIQISEKILEVFDLKQIIQFNDSQSLILRTRKVISREVK